MHHHYRTVDCVNWVNRGKPGYILGTTRFKIVDISVHRNSANFEIYYLVVIYFNTYDVGTPLYYLWIQLSKFNGIAEN